MDINKDFYENLEKKFKVIYPESNKATYTSLLNFSNESDKVRQRWYRYKEGYSTALVKKIINDYNNNPNGIILDPFLGSGSTVIAANELSLHGVGFEVNPFSYYLSCLKLKNYKPEEKIEFIKSYKKILNLSLNFKDGNQSDLPKLSISHKVFNKNIEEYFMTVKYYIDNYTGNQTIKDLLKLGWLTTLEEVSLYKKAGNGLKKRTSSKTIVSETEKVEEILKKIFYVIANDMELHDIKFDCEIYNDSCLNVENYISAESISGVIFSPPYANSFDYTEIYKLELWFGDFVKEYSDLKKLRQVSLRSHLNAFNNENQENMISTHELNSLLQELNGKELWNKNIPKMLAMYFDQMFSLLDSIYTVLEKDGFCSMVVGNSSYGGVVFPTDLILASYAEDIGFSVDKVEVDRYIITSSQQYFKTINSRKFLRESIVCLKKN
ncbi:DNA methyltransferase [Streptococcus pluranimalium]|uniref:DNA methyltransferase n=1 Tax=Streptococcus pluranimalium TaxID=82348 RepID=UPI003F6912DC